MENNELTERVIGIVRGHCPVERYEIGIADLDGLLPEKFARYVRGISLVRKLDDRIIDGITSGPTREYLGHYHAINAELDEVCTAAADGLARAGIEALPFQATKSDYELDENGNRLLRSTLSHKMVATRAGLGWIGKTDLLVTRRFGTRARLASILLADPAIAAGTACAESLCGSCRRCVESCPAAAATGLAWRAGMEREEFFDAHACRRNCLAVSERMLQETISICGICVAVCPRGKCQATRE